MSHKHIDTLLVANRGEIACRVFRTATRLGHGTAAVFTDADRGALHTRSADVAVAIESYLDADEILRAADRIGADVLLLNTSFAGPALAEVLVREFADGSCGVMHDDEFTGIVIEKRFQRGGEAVRAEGVRVEALAVIDGMEAGVIRFG